jgi:hypothetical protein
MSDCFLAELLLVGVTALAVLLFVGVVALAVTPAGFCCLLGRAVWVDLLSTGGAPLDKFFMGEGPGAGDAFLVPSGLPKNCRG